MKFLYTKILEDNHSTKPKIFLPTKRPLDTVRTPIPLAKLPET